MTAVRTIAALLAVVLVACSSPPAELYVAVCHAWTDTSAPQLAASFDVAVSVDDPAAQVPLGACRTLGPYASGTAVTVATPRRSWSHRFRLAPLTPAGL